MRQIKFRGQRLDNGEWIEGDLIRMYGRTFIFPDPAPNSIDQYEVAPETLGQCIGLKDKFGKEIYEGDIVEHNYYHSVRVVKWVDEQAQFDGWYKCEEPSYIIHGNIHDESLKRGKL